MLVRRRESPRAEVLCAMRHGTQPSMRSCGAENAPGEKFCGECGAALSATRAAAQPVASVSAAPAISVTEEQPNASPAVAGDFRVPAIIVSPWTQRSDMQPGEHHELLDHVSVLKLLAAKSTPAAAYSSDVKQRMVSGNLADH